MSEAEILATRNDVTAILVSVVSISFGMISAYIVALWAFLRAAPLSLRLMAFSLLSLGLVFMGGVSVGLHHMLLGTERAWSKLASNSMELTGFGNERPGWALGYSLFDIAAGLGALAFLGIYLALLGLTFCYRWDNAPPPRADL